MTPLMARRAGLATVTATAASIVVAPLHALARFATADGASDLESPIVSAWAEPARIAAGRLLTFASPDTVYTTYGKFWLLFMASVVWCALAMRSQRPGVLSAGERWGWRLALTGYTLTALGSLVSYWLLLVDLGYLFLTIPGLLIGFIGSTTLGVALLRRRVRPRITGWLLTLDVPLTIVMSSMGSMATGVWPLALAWGAAGWQLWRSSPSQPLSSATAPVESPSRAR
jgi:hypothetical protein